MLNLFKKTDPIKKLQKRYEKLMKEYHQLSHTDRKAADFKMAEADEIAKEIERLKKG